MMGTICHDPGKVESGVKSQEPSPKASNANLGGPSTALVFSPHPDDDVISMGGTIIRMVEQGHKVHIAYMTNGNIAVFDHDAWRFTDYICSFNELFGIDKERSNRVKECVQHFLKSKKPGQPDIDDLLNIK